MTNRIRTAFYGTRHSHFSGKLKAVADNPAYEIVGICEPVGGSRLPYPELTEAAMLGDASIQLIVVETPPAEGLPYAQKAIAAGKHLHVEKPPTRLWEPFQKLIEEARGKHLLVQTGYIWRFHEGIRRSIEAAKNGWLGHVYLMRGTIHTDIPERSRRELAQFKGGMMFELGCHQIDRVVALFGRPKKVSSWLHQVGKDGLADSTMAVLEYDRAMAVITTSAQMPNAGPHRSFEILGSDGAIVLQPVEPGTRMRVNLREARGPYRAGWQEVELPPQPRYVGDFRDLARAITTRTPLEYSYDFELLVQETVLRAAQEL